MKHNSLEELKYGKNTDGTLQNCGTCGRGDKLIGADEGNIQCDFGVIMKACEICDKYAQAITSTLEDKK